MTFSTFAIIKQQQHLWVNGTQFLNLKSVLRNFGKSTKFPKYHVSISFPPKRWYICSQLSNGGVLGYLAGQQWLIVPSQSTVKNGDSTECRSLLYICSCPILHPLYIPRSAYSGLFRKNFKICNRFVFHQACLDMWVQSAMRMWQN